MLAPSTSAAREDAAQDPRTLRDRGAGRRAVRGRLGRERGESGGRWRRFGYEELARRDKLNLDVFWLKDESLQDAEDLPEPQVIAQEIVEDLQAALEEFQAITAELEE